MLALSIRQPFAWLITQRYKDIENRDWKYPQNFRGRFLIHAAKAWYPSVKNFDDAEDLVKEISGLDIHIPRNIGFGGIVGEATLVDIVLEHPSRWFFGPKGLVLKDAMPLPFYPCSGQLGFFEVNMP